MWKIPRLLFSKQHGYSLRTFASSVPSIGYPSRLIRTTNEDEMKRNAPISCFRMTKEDLKGMSVTYLPKASLAEKGPKTLWDSYVEVSFPLSSNEKLRNQFVRSNHKNVRFGRLFECLDSIAGEVAYRHCVGGWRTDSGVALVTARIENVRFFNPGISIAKDLRLRSYIVYVGNSSMDIRTEIYSGDTLIGDGIFVFVCLDTKTQQVKKVPELSISDFGGAEEEEMLRHGKERSIERKAEKSLTRDPPSEEEIAIMHQIWNHTSPMSNVLLDAKKRRAREPAIEKEIFIHERSQFSGEIDIEETSVITASLMQSDNQNVNHKMFGGYMARKAMETSWLCAQRFLRTDEPHFVGVDTIEFKLPVEVGAMVQNHARVTFTALDVVHIQVDSVVISPCTDEKVLANVYHFFYRTSSQNKHLLVIPRTYEQYISYMDGRRRYLRRKANGKDKE